MFPAHVLPQLTGFLQEVCEDVPTWGEDHAFFLFLRNKYFASTAKAERMLLEPWRSLRGLSQVFVDRKLVSPAYADSLEASMTSMKGFDPQEWLKTMTARKEAAVALLSEGRLHDSWNMSGLISELMINTLDEATHHTILQSMPRSFHRAVYRLPCEAELNTTLAILCLQQPPDNDELWSMALHSANIAIDITEDRAAWIWEYESMPSLWTPDNDASWYTDIEHSDTRVRRGNIMMALGEWSYACTDLEIANGITPGNPTIEGALEDAIKQVNPEVRPGAMLERHDILWVND